MAGDSGAPRGRVSAPDGDCLLAPHLTADNHRQVLEAARHKSKREVEEIVARLRPQPPVPSSIRKLPVPKTPAPARPGLVIASPFAVCTAPELAPVQAAVEKPRVEVKPLAPEQYKVQFTVDRETYDKLREAQDLLRHRVPNGAVCSPSRFRRSGHQPDRR